MNRHEKPIVIFVVLIVLFTSIKAMSQERNWHKSLLKLLKTDQYHKMENFQKTEKFNKKQEKNQHAIYNINEHLKQAAKLRAQGKTPEEIRAYFDAQRAILGTGSISGMVYESDGVTPVQNFVAVKVYDDYGQYAGSDYISSYDNGAYTISELSTGDYFVMTSSDYYFDEYYDNVTNWQDATLVHVTDGRETSGIDFTLEHYEGVISGKVFGVDGTPLNDCGISAYDEGHNWINSGYSDDNGYYVVSGLPSGGHKLLVTYWGSENYIGEWYDNAQSFETATVVTVTEPDTTKGINFILDHGGAIVGRVFDPMGEPVGAHESYITAYDADENHIVEESTDENGNFIISKLPTGIYKLRVSYSYPGKGNYLGVWYDGADDFETATPIAVMAPDTTKDVYITLRAAGAISGRVFGPDGQLLETADGLMTVYDEHQDRVTWGQISQNGIYTMSQLPTGRYKLFYEYWGHTRIVGQEPASEWYDGVYEFEDATFVEVNAPDTTTNIDFTLERGGYIMGHVYDPQGQALEYSGSIEVYKLDGQLVHREGRIANDGLYFVTGLPTGEYKLRINYDGEENYFEEWYDEKPNFETATTVSVTAQNMVPNIDFTLEYASSIQGFVTDTAGNRLTDKEYFIEVFIWDAYTGEYINSTVISFVGGYELELQGRNYKLGAVSFYVNTFPNQDSLAVTYYKNGTSFSDPNTQTISLLPDSTLTLDDLIMEKASGSISGTIYYKYGDIVDPMSFGMYYIFVFDEQGYLVKVSAYSEWAGPISGEYVFSGLRPGKYYVMASIGLFLSLSQLYDGVEVDIETLSSFPINIPSSASAVTVGEAEISGIDFIFDLSTDVEQETQKMPQSFKLAQNYPNPFNPITTIEYQLPQRAYVEIHIYNVLGQKVATLVKGQQSIGVHSVKWDASNMPSGIYFYRIEAGKFKQTKKCLLLK